MNVQIKNIEIKSITKIGTEFNNQNKIVFTKNHQKIFSKDKDKDKEVEIKKIKLKKFSSKNINSKQAISHQKKINIMNKQTPLNKKKEKIEYNLNDIKKQIKIQKSFINTPQENSKEFTSSNNFYQKKLKHYSNITSSKKNYYTNQKNIENNSRKKESKKITKNLSRENMYINASNINNTYNNFLLGGTQRKKLNFKENDKNSKNNRLLQLYNINNNCNNIYNDELTAINNTNINEIYTTNYTTKNTNNRNSAKNVFFNSSNIFKKDKKINLINKFNINKDQYGYNHQIKIDTNNINNIINGNIKKLEIKNDQKNNKNNSKTNLVKNIKDIIIENSNHNINLMHSFKSEINIHNAYNSYNTFNTYESNENKITKKSLKSKIQNLKNSNRSNCNSVLNNENKNQSYKNKTKLKNKVIKLKDVNKNFNHIINNGVKFNSTTKNSNNNIYITYVNNSSFSNNNNSKITKVNNIYSNNFHINKSNSNLISISKSKFESEGINNRNSLIKSNTLQNEDAYKSKINFSPHKATFLEEKKTKKINLRRPLSNKHKNEIEKINYSPRINTMQKYIQTESNISNINIFNNNNILLNKFDILENNSLSTRKDINFSKLNNFMLKGTYNQNKIINLLNKRKLSEKIFNTKRSPLLEMKDKKLRDKDIKKSKKIKFTDINNNSSNKENNLFNIGVKTTKNMNKKDIILNKKYSYINILKPKSINQQKRYSNNATNIKEFKERIIDNSKRIISDGKSLTFISKEKKKNASLLKQKKMIKLIHLIDELNNSKTNSKSKKKNKSSSHFNNKETSSKKSNNIEGIKFNEDKNIIENVIQNNMTMYSIYLISKYENNFKKIGIEKIGLYDKNNKEIFILYSNSNINKDNNEEENVNYLFNNKYDIHNGKSKFFSCEYKENLYINFYINVKKSYNLKYIKIINYTNQIEEISPVKEIKIYHEKKKLFNGILNIKGENIIDISENNNKINLINKKRGNSASNCNNKTNIYNINYITYKKNNNVRSYSTFRHNSGRKINKIPKITKLKSVRNLSNKAHLIKNSNIYNNTEIYDDTHYDNNNIIIYNICNTIPYNNYNDNETKEDIIYNNGVLSKNKLEISNNMISLENNQTHKETDINEFNDNYDNNENSVGIINNNNLNFIKFKIIRMVLSSNYGHKNNIGLTGLEFFDINNKLINIETADTIGALPKDLHTIYKDVNENRIFENIFNGENNTDDSYNMWLTLLDPNKSIKDLPYIELSFNETISLSKIRFHNYNKINQLDKCLKTADIFLDNKFFGKIFLRQGLGYAVGETTTKKNSKNDNDDDNIIKNDFSQDITFPLNNDFYKNIYKDKDNFDNFIYDEEKGLNIEYASLKFEQCYETPFMPNGYIIKFQLLNNFYQCKKSEQNIENKNYIGINISNIYDENGSDLLSQKKIKYKIVSNKEMILLENNKYILNSISNDDNNYLFFLFEYPINISYISIKPLYQEEQKDNFYNSAKDIKIFCDTSIIFEGRLYQSQPTIILFTSNEKIVRNINTQYLTKQEINRNFIENITEEYYSMAFT